MSRSVFFLGFLLATSFAHGSGNDIYIVNTEPNCVPAGEWCGPCILGRADLFPHVLDAGYGAGVKTTNQHTVPRLVRVP
jgi:hypothetical protein